MSQTQTLKDLQEMISSMERTLFAMRGMISEISGEKPLLNQEKFLQQASQPTGYNTAPAGRIGLEEKIVEGAFNGQQMQDMDGNTYPVPVNYASKSKMVVGDRMKLTIMADGKFVYKQIGPANRRNIIGPLTVEDGQYKVLAEGKEYNILTASITFHKAQIGDEVSILVPEEGEAKWGALDVVMPKE